MLEQIQIKETIKKCEKEFQNHEKFCNFLKYKPLANGWHSVTGENRTILFKITADLGPIISFSVVVKEYLDTKTFLNGQDLFLS